MYSVNFLYLVGSYSSLPATSLCAEAGWQPKVLVYSHSEMQLDEPDFVDKCKCCSASPPRTTEPRPPPPSERRCWPGKAGLLFLGGAGEAEVLAGGSATQTDAVWVEPLHCSQAAALGLAHGSVFLLSSMEWNGLQPGVAGYVLYGSATLLTLSLAGPPVQFTLDQNFIFRLTARQIEIPPAGEGESVAGEVVTACWRGSTGCCGWADHWWWGRGSCSPTCWPCWLSSPGGQAGKPRTAAAGESWSCDPGTEGRWR